VDENALYRVSFGPGKEELRLGSDLKDGIDVNASARITIEPLRR
jgi:hypothetical protein